MCCVIDATPADVERLLPFLTAADDHATAATDPCVVEQQMDLVSLLLRSNLIAEPLDLSVIGDIGDVRRNTQTLRQPIGLAEPLRFRHRLRKDIARRHVAAFGDQLANELSSHPAAATGDNCYPAGEFLHGSRPLGFSPCRAQK